MRTSRAVAHLAAAIVAATTLFLTAPAPAYAACSRSSCNYLDPNDSGCSADGRTLEAFRYSGPEAMLSGALIELRYSPRCWAGWLRVTGGSCYNWPGGCGAVLEASNPKGVLIDEYSFSNATGGTWYSGMLNYEWWLRACFVRWDDGVARGYTRLACTAWR